MSDAKDISSTPDLLGAVKALLINWQQMLTAAEHYYREWGGVQSRERVRAWSKAVEDLKRVIAQAEGRHV